MGPYQAGNIALTATDSKTLLCTGPLSWAVKSWYFFLLHQCDSFWQWRLLSQEDAGWKEDTGLPGQEMDGKVPWEQSENLGWPLWKSKAIHFQHCHEDNPTQYHLHSARDAIWQTSLLAVDIMLSKRTRESADRMWSLLCLWAHTTIQIKKAISHL